MDSEGKTLNWTEAVEDLVEEGETEKAISLLETLISKLEKGTQKAASFSSSDELVTALLDLAKLYSSKGFSLKADQTRQRALRINQESQDDVLFPKGDLNVVNESFSDATLEDSGQKQSSSDLPNDSSPTNDGFGEDWEAIADRAPDELLSPQCLPEVSQLSLEDTPPQVQGPKRRGRGTFSYGRRSLYSDDSVEKAEDAQSDEEEDTKTKDSTSKNYGTRHVVVVSGFSPSTKTIDLEKLFDKFKDGGFAIRWVNDTVALAVFSSPSTALEACTSIDGGRFTVRQLDEDDELLNSITKRGVEHVEGDMFVQVPTGDAIILKYILHDWSDEASVKLLKNCLKALPAEGGKVIVIELILPEIVSTDVVSRSVYTADILMHVMTDGGKERSFKQYEKLANEARFKSSRLVSRAYQYGVIEMYNN